MKKLLNEQLPITNTNPIKARFFDYHTFTYPWHFHSQYELIYIEKGYGQCIIGDGILPYTDEELILIGPNLPHVMQSAADYETDESLRVNGVIIQFETDFMQYSFSHYIQFIPVQHLLEDSQRGICFSLKKHPHIQEMLKQMPVSKGVSQIILILSLLDALAECKQRRFGTSPNYAPTSETFKDKKTEKIIAYLHKNYTRTVTLEEIASFAAMNPAAFCRYFKSATGKTLKGYILDMRIGYACKLLAAEEINIAQVSLECGFESVSHFNRSFKKLLGMSPTEYKETILK
ncbi:AraC family transcriptional regulator [uncultured Bacteroides sp.]|uniref:AraC family transcriptional regulator n=1 Tax=uncultured Bacteroides sp. TaxID=162156 RepID=UPI00262FE5D8|nr:AraC family transcriptional regulator [uncultured Bacteroides sp.]